MQSLPQPREQLPVCWRAPGLVVQEGSRTLSRKVGSDRFPPLYLVQDPTETEDQVFRASKQRDHFQDLGQHSAVVLLCELWACVSLALAGVRVVQQRLDEELEDLVTVQLEGARKGGSGYSPIPPVPAAGLRCLLRRPGGRPGKPGNRASLCLGGSRQQRRPVGTSPPPRPASWQPAQTHVQYSRISPVSMLMLSTKALTRDFLVRKCCLKTD